MRELLSNASDGPLPFKDAELVFENIMDGNLSEIEIASFLSSEIKYPITDAYKVANHSLLKLLEELLQ